MLMSDMLLYRNMEVGNLVIFMRFTILQIMKFLSFILLIGFFNIFRHILFRRKLWDCYEENKEEILKAIRSDKLNYYVFFKEPRETGNNQLDLLLFKIHRTAIWFMLSIILYAVSVCFIYLLFILLDNIA